MVSDKEVPRRLDLGNVQHDALSTGAQYLGGQGKRVTLTLTQWMPDRFVWQAFQADHWVVLYANGIGDVAAAVHMTQRRNNRECAEGVAAALNRIYGA